jgi:hypothetical protein
VAGGKYGTSIFNLIREDAASAGDYDFSRLIESQHL